MASHGDLSESAAEAVEGRVEVAPQAIATVARAALMECYGVVGLATGARRPSLRARLGRADPFTGIEVAMADGEITLTLHVIVEYGVRISEVARNIMENVSFAVEQALGMPVRAVNVHVDGLHLTQAP